ncbi:glutathione S-transferase N-terminal domain-containing protein [Polyangium fumosum]|uniref:glutathione S-transferase N-terminal domain-containing protein n=1 Tax=Polyangium fumosum TaxID=889272 RepID=UPI003B83365F
MRPPAFITCQTQRGFRRMKLCGFRISNYHNKVRLVLLEKGIPHEEDPSCWPSQEPAFLARSPMGRAPFLETPHGVLCESQVICEYLEEAYPDNPLISARSIRPRQGPRAHPGLRAQHRARRAPHLPRRVHGRHAHRRRQGCDQCRSRQRHPRLLAARDLRSVPRRR